MINIYRITNTKNGITYIGQTELEVEERLQAHLNTARKNKGFNEMHIDMINQNYNGFIVEKIDECFDRHKFIIEKY